jgi:predicted nuclease of predicted toxin-antitoxin system
VKSKRHSGSKSEPPEPLIFFVDRSLGRGVVAALKKAGAIVHAHDDLFPPDAPDTQWLTEVGKHDWVVLTKDQHIRRRPMEKDALLAANLRVFVLTSGNMRGEEMAELFVRNLPKMEAMARRIPAPFIGRLTRTEPPTVVYPA